MFVGKNLQDKLVSRLIVSRRAKPARKEKQRKFGSQNRKLVDVVTPPCTVGKTGSIRVAVRVTFLSTRGVSRTGNYAYMSPDRRLDPVHRPVASCVFLGQGSRPSLHQRMY